MPEDVGALPEYTVACGRWSHMGIRLYKLRNNDTFYIAWIY